MIYFIRSAGGGPIKIGTTVRLSVRLKQLSEEFGTDLRLLGVMDGGYEKEQTIHKRFGHLRLGFSAVNERFRPAVELLRYIADNAHRWDGSDDAPPLKPDIILVYKADHQSSVEFKTWLNELADHVGAPVTITIDMALKEFAAKRKFRNMPKRLVR